MSRFLEMRGLVDAANKLSDSQRQLLLAALLPELQYLCLNPVVEAEQIKQALARSLERAK